MPAPPLKITVLGSGTSVGVPTIGCHCDVCRSPDPRDNRLRPSILVSYDGHNVLIDTTPDFRAQALRARIDRLDAEVLHHPRAEAADPSHAADFAPIATGTVGVRAVFDQRQPLSCAQRPQACQLQRRAIHVHGDDRPGPRGDGRFQLRNIHVQRLNIYVHQSDSKPILV